MRDLDGSGTGVPLRPLRALRSALLDEASLPQWGISEVKFEVATDLSHLFFFFQ